VVRTMVKNNNTTRSISICKALRYAGCSKNMYYGKDRRNKITAAVTADTAFTSIIPSISTIEQEIQQITMTRTIYFTRRMAAILIGLFGIPITRKRIQIIFRKMDYITPSKSKMEILRSKIPI